VRWQAQRDTALVWRITDKSAVARFALPAHSKMSRCFEVIYANSSKYPTKTTFD
jgi:hypothetical protein